MRGVGDVGLPDLLLRKQKICLLVGDIDYYVVLMGLEREHRCSYYELVSIYSVIPVI